jgi:ABC-type sugar transport system ATPase subunit
VSEHLRLEGVSKRFGGVHALEAVSVSVERGHVHALVGENGAGKSTLGQLIAGALVPDTGTIFVDGAAASLRSPRDGQKYRIARIAQEIALAPQLSVLQNVFLGVETRRNGFLDHRRLRERFSDIAADAGLGLDPDAAVASLRLADQQKVEILRALARDADMLVMDEPTAALNKEETTKLLDIVRRLRDRGKTIIYVSHFLEEVLLLADEVTVLKDGKVVRTAPAAQETPASLIQAMLGVSLEMAFPSLPPQPSHDDPVLSVRKLRAKPLVNDVSFDLRAGEILGLAGLVGSGRSELAHAVFGAVRLSGGDVAVGGETLRIRSPKDAIRAGLALLPESRKDQGLMLGRPIAENVTLAYPKAIATLGFTRIRREHRVVSSALATVNVPETRVREPVSTLSGGNQQRVLFAKWLFGNPKVLVADEPTRGVDVGAKRAIYELLVSLAERGIGILLISSDFEELIGLCHRVLAVRAGVVVAEIVGDEITEPAIMAAVFGTESSTVVSG